MKINIITSNPSRLKNEIIELIEEGELKTWSIHHVAGIDYLKHTQQWGEKGAIKLTVNNSGNELNVKVIRIKGITDKVEDFGGYYLGRFAKGV